MTAARSRRAIAMLAALIGAAIAVGVGYLVTDRHSSPTAVGEPGAMPTSPTPQLTLPPPMTTPPTATPTPAPISPPAATTSAHATTSPRSWPFPVPTTTYAPLTVTSAISPTDGGTTQTSYTLSVRLRDGDGSAYVGDVTWGDGTAWHHAPIAMYSCAVMPLPTKSPAPYSPSPSDVTVTMHHAWRVAGTYTVTVDATSGGNSCAPSSPRVEHVSRSFTVQIDADGTVTSNGPATPGFLKVSSHQDPKTHQFDLGGASLDSDGFITQIDVDWGDGSTHGVFTRSLSDCDDHGGAAYPNDQEWSVEPLFSHTYKKAGTFKVMVTFTSVGCDGQDAQTGVTKGTATV